MVTGSSPVGRTSFPQQIARFHFPRFRRIRRVVSKVVTGAFESTAFRERCAPGNSIAPLASSTWFVRAISADAGRRDGESGRSQRNQECACARSRNVARDSQCLFPGSPRGAGAPLGSDREQDAGELWPGAHRGRGERWRPKQPGKGSFCASADPSPPCPPRHPGNRAGVFIVPACDPKPVLGKSQASSHPRK